MAQTTTYTCDRCKAQAVDNSNFLTPVHIEYGTNWSRSGYTGSQIPAASWCIECIVAMGIAHPCSLGTELPVPASRPTLEEVIRAIMREEIQAVQQ